MKKHQEISEKNRVENIVLCIINPFLRMFGCMEKILKLFATKKRHITAIAMCFVMILTILPIGAFALLPISTFAADSSQTRWGYISEDSTLPAVWTSSGKLADAIKTLNNSATGTMYIQLMSNVSTTELEIDTNNDVVLDLNGHVLSANDTGVILQSSIGKLTITDSTTEKNGKISSKVLDGSTITQYYGTLVLENATVENTGAGCAIFNLGGKTEIMGGMVCSSQGYTIMSQYGRLNVSGGVVTANDTAAIFINGGENTISAAAKIISANTKSNSGTVYLPNYSSQVTSNPILKITGGMIENTAEQGNAIYIRNNNTVEISGGTVNASGVNGTGIFSFSKVLFTKGTSVIKGRGMAMNIIPEMSIDTQLGASTKYDSDSLASYQLVLKFQNDFKSFLLYSYKYFRFEPSTAVAKIGTKFYTDLQEAFDYCADGSTIQLLSDIHLRQTIFAEKGKTLTLDLNGKTISSNFCTIIHNAWCTLTITDNSDEKNGSIECSSDTAIKNHSKLIIAGGTIISTASQTYTINNQLSGTVDIVGGTVCSQGDRSYTIYNAYYLGTVNVSGGTVSASGNSSIAIFSKTSGAINISDGTVSSKLYTAIHTMSGSINIHTGYPIIQGGTKAMNVAPNFDPAILIATASYDYEGDSFVAYDAAKFYEYKYIDFMPAPIPVGNEQSGTPPEANTTTVYNDPINSNATIWLSGKNLSADDLLLTKAITSGGSYEALLKLADKKDVLNIYEISLESGITLTGDDMNITFDLTSEYAQQKFTLVHEKSNGTFEYLYAMADEEGKATFGPIRELSKFMLVKGQLINTPKDNVVDIPQTGEFFSFLPFALFTIATVCGVGTMQFRKKRKEA